MNFQNLTIFNQHPDGQQQQMARNENSATKCRWQKNKKTNAKYSLAILARAWPTLLLLCLLLLLLFFLLLAIA